MSLIRAIKDKILTLDGYIRSNTAMKSVASVRMSKYKKKIRFFEEVVTIFSDELNVDKPNFEEILEKSGEKRKFGHVIIGCNQGMCGAFFGKISGYIKYFLKHRQSSDVVCILGEKFLDYKLGNNVFTETIELSNTALFNLGERMYQFILNNKITDLYFHYSDRNGIKKRRFIKDRYPNLNFSVFDMLKLILMLVEACFISGFYENKERVVALEQAKNNAKTIQKKIYNELNRLRQDSITNDLTEIVAGVLL